MARTKNETGKVTLYQWRDIAWIWSHIFLLNSYYFYIISHDEMALNLLNVQHMRVEKKNDPFIRRADEYARPKQK